MSDSERSDAESQKKRCESVNARVTELRENNQIRRKQKTKQKRSYSAGIHYIGAANQKLQAGESTVHNSQKYIRRWLYYYSTN